MQNIQKHGNTKSIVGIRSDKSVITTVPSVSYQSIGCGGTGTHGELQLISPPGLLQSTRWKGGKIQQAIVHSVPQKKKERSGNKVDWESIVYEI